MILIIFIFILFTKTSLASDEFSVVQNISYTINGNGSVNVSHEINLTNNISQIFAKEYQLNLSNTNIQNLQANDKNGSIINSLITDNDHTSINVKFSAPVVGKDQTNQFFLNYTVPEFAKKKGNTWEIQFPVYKDSGDNQHLNINLLIPNTFGELSFSSIPINSTHQINNNTQIVFSQNQSVNKILMVFGNHQLFDFKLNYFVQNQDNKEILTNIPIPPDTNYQTIVFKNIFPLPQKIWADNDGNWLAQYLLKPSEQLNITVEGQAKIHPPIPIENVAGISNQTDPQTYWPTDDPQITTIVRDLQTPKQIYRYVVNTLNYNYSLIDSAKRMGALSAIQNPDNSLCTEFTDLFVTLARAAHIPAREIEGYAYSNNSKIKPINTNSDVLHAWPEYYDSIKKTWIQTDPTWEKTTNGIDYFSDLDLNHLTFVIHGLNSISPPPPGSYKKDQLTKSVFVDFAVNSLQPTYIPPSISISDSKIIIRNPNLFAQSKFTLRLTNYNWTKTISSLPPLAVTQLDLPVIPFWKTALPSYRYYHFEIETKDSPTPIYNNLTNPLHYLYLCICLGMIIMSLCLGGIILTTSIKTK